GRRAAGNRIRSGRAKRLPRVREPTTPGQSPEPLSLPPGAGYEPTRSRQRARQAESLGAGATRIVVRPVRGIYAQPSRARQAHPLFSRDPAVHRGGEVALRVRPVWGNLSGMAG